jgi:hypothetical protein
VPSVYIYPCVDRFNEVPHASEGLFTSPQLASAVKIGRADDHGDGISGEGMSKKLGVGLDCRAATVGFGRGAGELTPVQAEHKSDMMESVGFRAMTGEIRRTKHEIYI